MISHITDSNGQTFYDHSDIESAFTNHFHELWSEHTPSSFSEIFQAFPTDLSKLSNNDGLFLTRDITKLKVHQSLLSLLNGKSPSPDGFNVEFYYYFWDDISGSLFFAIQFFLIMLACQLLGTKLLLLSSLRSLIPY